MGVSVSWCPGHNMGHIITLLPLLLSSQVDSRTLMRRSSPDVITGRGFAAPPKLNIETYSSPGSPGPSYSNDPDLTRGQHAYYSEGSVREAHSPPGEYQHNYQYEDISGHYPSHQSYQSSSYLPTSEYQRLKDKLYTNEQLKSYIKELRQQIKTYENIVPHNHERGTKIDLSRYHHNEPYIKSFSGSRNQGLETEKWLRSRQHQSSYQHNQNKRPQLRFPVQEQVDDIITVDNAYQYVEKPKGPDSFTINVESALNFS